MNSWKLFLIWTGISVGIFKKHGEGSSTRRFAISSILRYRTQCLMTTVAFKTYSRSSVTTTSVPPSPSQMPTDFSASGSMHRSSSVTEVAWGSLCTSSPSSLVHLGLWILPISCSLKHFSWVPLQAHSLTLDAINRNSKNVNFPSSQSMAPDPAVTLSYAYTSKCLLIFSCHFCNLDPKVNSYHSGHLFLQRHHHPTYRKVHIFDHFHLFFIISCMHIMFLDPIHPTISSPPVTPLSPHPLHYHFSS